jgi:hypothetical protein
MHYRRNKHGNIAVKVQGRVFASRLEARRANELEILQKAGKIRDLKYQVPFELIPAQYEEYETGELFKKGPLKGQPKVKRRCIERSCVYVADFTYITADGHYVVEDTKGDKTEKYIIKRKLMLYLHKIKIREVTKND